MQVLTEISFGGQKTQLNMLLHMERNAILNAQLSLGCI
uniref:Uncharacterized protein n=1 Tax=Arundo donax TaxID=35708 RepID=A0A0A9HCM0_ARUDO